MNRLDLSQLNPVQKEAVLQTEGPCLIIAGPGSGKTRVLTHRVAYLIKEKNVPPYRIMVLTFTKKAANEMKERLAPMIGDKVKQVWMGTFHHVFCKILRREADQVGFSKDFSIYDTEDSKRLIVRIRKELSLPEESYKTPAILRRISQAKRKLISAAIYQQNDIWCAEDIACNMPQFHVIYNHYEVRCRAANAMDFDDILFHTYRLFRDHPERLTAYQERFSHLFVDEFQDTDTIQYEILQGLAQRHNNLCVIGDDAQSIYSFRGAEIKHILNFQQTFPHCSVFKLEENYRSTKYIVQAANSLIKHNKQHTKVLFTNNTQGDPIQLFPMFNELEEADFVTNNLLRAHGEGKLTYDQAVILYRTNSQSRVLEEACVRKQIPYKVLGSLSFYQRQEVKDLLAYLHLIVNPNNEEALIRAINQPKRNIGPITLGKGRNYATAHNLSLWESLLAAKKWLSGQVARNIEAFTSLIEASRASLETKNAIAIAQGIAQQSGLLALWGKSADESDKNRYENLEELLSSIRIFCEKKPEENSLASFLEEIALLTSGDENEDSTKPTIKLMTAHKAKGLEFPHVYIVGLEDELFPSTFASNNPSAIEEERRLFFVAITRAQQSLVLTYAENRYRHGKVMPCHPSPFLEELDPSCIAEHPRPMRPESHSFASGPQREHPYYRAKKRDAEKPMAGKTKIRELQIGMRMKHPSFGEGVVQTIESTGTYHRVVVNFLHAGKKTLLLKKNNFSHPR